MAKQILKIFGSPYLRSVVHGIVTAFLMLPLALFLTVGEMWGTVHLKFPLLILIVFVLLLNAFVETARGLWQGVICGILFATPIILSCWALCWYYWRDSDAYLRIELKFVAAASIGLSIILIPLILRLRHKVTPKN